MTESRLDLTNRVEVPRVAMFIDSLDPGGAESMSLQLASQLIARGVQVKLLHFGNEWLQSHAAKIGVSIERLRFHSAFRSKWFLPLFCVYFASKLRREGIRLLHAHLIGAVFAGALTGWIARLPVVGTLHDAYSICDNPNSQLMLRVCYLTNVRLVAVSKDIANLVAELIAKQSYVQTIYNGVMANQPRGTRGKEILQRATTDINLVRLVVVARLVPVKRIDRLLRILAMVDSQATWSLDILGDGPLLYELEGQAQFLGIESRVNFLGFVNQVTDRLHDYDIFLMSSDSEGLSMSLLEAMSAGLCCVVTGVGGNQELIHHHESGILVSVADEAKFAREVSQLIDSPSRRHDLGDAAQRRIGREFGLELMTDRYQYLYSEMSRQKIERRS